MSVRPPWLWPSPFPVDWDGAGGVGLAEELSRDRVPVADSAVVVDHDDPLADAVDHVAVELAQAHLELQMRKNREISVF